MGEAFAGAIEIGGTLPRAWLSRFLEAVHADGAHLDWGEEVVRLPAILASAPPGEPLTLTNHDASYGQFRAVEAVCHEIGLTYRRESAPHGEFDGEVIFWCPGMGAPASTPTNVAGEICVSLDALRGHLVRGDSLADVVALLDARVGEVPVFLVDSGPLGGGGSVVCRRPRAHRGRGPN